MPSTAGLVPSSSPVPGLARQCGCVRRFRFSLMRFAEALGRHAAGAWRACDSVLLSCQKARVIAIAAGPFTATRGQNAAAHCLAGIHEMVLTMPRSGNAARTESREASWNRSEEKIASRRLPEGRAKRGNARDSSPLWPRSSPCHDHRRFAAPSDKALRCPPSPGHNPQAQPKRR